jgi:hypothetical protein
MDVPFDFAHRILSRRLDDMLDFDPVPSPLAVKY